MSVLYRKQLFIQIINFLPWTLECRGSFFRVSYWQFHSQYSLSKTPCDEKPASTGFFPVSCLVGVAAVSRPGHLLCSPKNIPLICIRGICFYRNGGIAGARTRDLGLKRALLYLLSYNPIQRNVGVLYKKTSLCPIFLDIFFFSL